ncbi:MAG: N-acetylmuramic acid 6-phosphate etherase [Betaproteobacteria bacterium]
MLDLEQRMTEEKNPRSRGLDLMRVEEILTLMNQEDQRVPLAVAEQLPKIAAAVNRITSAIKSGGRVFYIGAGTSGRIAAQDAAECPPTFGVSPDLFQVVMAGGPDALSHSVEWAEDSADDGYADLMSRRPTPRDVVIGIAASGETPYVVGGLSAARVVGCGRIALVCNPGSELERLAELTICPIVGPEVLTGSTRLKAGTAQKLVLNMISTAVMVMLGKVYDNYMVDMVASNNKLLARSRHIVEEACGVGPADAERLLQQAHGNLKVALVMGKTGVDSRAAAEALAQVDGVVRKAISLLLGGSA